MENTLPHTHPRSGSACNRFLTVLGAALFLTACPGSFEACAQTDWTLVGWNDLGMHCMDGTDFSVFSILPPYNNIHAHLLQGNRLVTETNGISVTYEAVADPDGSINRTSADKVNFWDYVEDFFGATPPPDMGLAGAAMPGAANIPQGMHFETGLKWFTAEGIPITPYDDDLRTNYYPMMRLKAWSNGVLLASTDIVLPVSDEMDCSACHQSGGQAAARPADGWTWDCDPDRDLKLNILRLHDQFQAGSPAYADALASQGYHPNGLLATVVEDGTAVLCARCHRSNALPGLGEPGLPPLTAAIHARHAYVPDPVNGMPLEAIANRESCYRCHPGSATRCLRGAMGAAVAADGTLAMQCQGCHGTMSDVGSPAREGWFEQPNCQSCHPGTANANSGLLRHTSVFNEDGSVRAASNNVFATTADTPLPGVSLYRFSAGHGGLQCSACHGSPHAIFPAAKPSDNIQSILVQGHVGTLAECSACHESEPTSFTGGPHGMHRVGPSWVDAEHGDERDHQKAAENGNHQQCAACHGTDFRGTELSRMFADRVIDTGQFGVKRFWRGQQIGCYDCHKGPTWSDANGNHAPVVVNASAVTTANTPAGLGLSASDADGDPMVLRMVSQPHHGSVALDGTQATYYPFANFIGSDSFTFAARDQAHTGNAYAGTDSNLGTGTVTVSEGLCSLALTAVAPTSAAVNVLVPFWAAAALDGCAGTTLFDWVFDDGSPAASERETCHAFAVPGTYAWSVVAAANGLSLTNSGTIVITEAVADEDHDGILDAWELTHFENLAAATATSDYDHDGFIDLYEFLAGTVPTNAASYLKVDSLQEPSPAGLLIRWASVSNRTYTLSRSFSLTTGNFSPIATGVEATPPMNTYTDVSAIVEWLSLYRVELE